MPDFSIARNLRYRLRFRLVQFNGFRSIPSGYKLLMVFCYTQDFEFVRYWTPAPSSTITAGLQQVAKAKQTLSHRYSFSHRYGGHRPCLHLGTMPEEIAPETLLHNVMETLSDGISRQNSGPNSVTSKFNKLFGHQKPVHHILGGGKYRFYSKVMEILLKVFVADINVGYEDMIVNTQDPEKDEAGGPQEQILPELLSKYTQLIFMGIKGGGLQKTSNIGVKRISESLIRG